MWRNRGVVTAGRRGERGKHGQRAAVCLVVDNAGFFHAGSDPRAVTDGEWYNRLVGEFPKWLGPHGHRGSYGRTDACLPLWLERIAVPP